MDILYLCGYFNVTTSAKAYDEFSVGFSWVSFDRESSGVADAADASLDVRKFIGVTWEHNGTFINLR